jgi:hypothetical protein
MDLTREGYAPLDLALTDFVLQLSVWLDGVDDATLDPRIAVKWLEQLDATIRAVEPEGLQHFRDLATQLAAEADEDSTRGSGDEIRRHLEILVGDDLDSSGPT